MKKIGIIGNGFVGKATKQLACAEIEILAYDIDPLVCDPVGTTLETLVRECNIIFISVPTPMEKNGKCHLDILKTVVHSLNNLQYNGIKVIRSTVPVGTSQQLGCYFMPEFLTEKNYIQDFIQNKHWIFGLLNIQFDEIFERSIRELFDTAHKHGRIQYNSLHFTSTDNAEMTKLYRNCFLAVKVSFCNEMYQFCEKKNLDYDTIQYLGSLDDRIGSSHSKIPGPDGKHGFGGTCFPKDMSNLLHQMEKEQMESFIIKNSILRNETVDRPEQDWSNNKGRAVIE